MHRLFAIVAATALAIGAVGALGSCTAEKEPLGPSTGTCPSGKCDGFADTLEDYYSDMRSIGLDDYPQQDLRVYTRGEDAELINASLFNIEELL